MTPVLAKKVTTLNFVTGNREAFESGMHPFIFNQYSPKERHQVSEIAMMYFFGISRFTGITSYQHKYHTTATLIWEGNGDNVDGIVSDVAWKCCSNCG